MGIAFYHQNLYLMNFNLEFFLYRNTGKTFCADIFILTGYFVKFWNYRCTCVVAFGLDRFLMKKQKCVNFDMRLACDCFNCWSLSKFYYKNSDKFPQSYFTSWRASVPLTLVHQVSTNILPKCNANREIWLVTSLIQWYHEWWNSTVK